MRNESTRTYNVRTYVLDVLVCIHTNPSRRPSPPLLRNGKKKREREDDANDGMRKLGEKGAITYMYYSLYSGGTKGRAGWASASPKIILHPPQICEGKNF